MFSFRNLNRFRTSEKREMEIDGADGCEWNYRDRQVSVYLLGELHPLALFPIDVDDEAVHLAAESAYEPRDYGLVRATHLCCPRPLPCGLCAPTHTHARTTFASVSRYRLTERLHARSLVLRESERISEREMYRAFHSSRFPPEFVYRRLRSRHTERAPSNVQVQDRIRAARHPLTQRACRYILLLLLLLSLLLLSSRWRCTVFLNSPGFALIHNSAVLLRCERNGNGTRLAKRNICSPDDRDWKLIRKQLEKKRCEEISCRGHLSSATSNIGTWIFLPFIVFPARRLSRRFNGYIYIWGYLDINTSKARKEGNKNLRFSFSLKIVNHIITSRRELRDKNRCSTQKTLIS